MPIEGMAAPESLAPAARGSRAPRLALSLGLTALFGYWAFRDARVDELWASLRTANYAWLLPHLVLLTGVHALRALRWGCLLSALERVPFRHLNAATAVGNMLLLVLPLRLGEFARPVLISQRSTIRASAAMASVVLERLIDGLAIALLLEAALWVVPGDTPALRYVRWGSHLMLAGFVGLFGFLFIAQAQRQRTVGLVRALLGRVSPGLAERVAAMVESFIAAVRQLPGWPQASAALACTVALWGLSGLAIWQLAWAFDCGGGARAGCAPLPLGLFESFVVLGVTVLGGMIPAAPGLAGTYQAGVKASLAIFLPAVLVDGTGLAFANVMWLATVAHQVLLGLAFMAAGHWQGLRRPPASP